MVSKPGKDLVISFKADAEMARALEDIPNRSEFIRAAVQSALEGTCPLCHGTGILSPQQKKHWDSFARTHELRRCQVCQAVHLVCREGHAPLPEEYQAH